MAQLRHDHSRFKALNAEVLVVVPNGPKMIARHVSDNGTPYPILSDKGAAVAKLYQIDARRTLLPSVTVFTPTVLLVDRSGSIRYTNYTTSYIKEPDNNEPLAELARMVA